MSQQISLVVHQAALGDMVVILPLLRRLAQDGPVMLATSFSKGKLAKRLIPGILPIDIESRFWTSLHSDAPLSQTWPLDEHLPPLDRIVSFVSNGQDAWASNAQKLAPSAQRYFVRPRPPEDWIGHVADWHLHQLPPLSPLSPSSHSPAIHHADRSILIHPGSGGQEKCWSIQRYIELIHRLTEQRSRIQVILGEAETHLANSHPFPCPTEISTDLDSLADAIASARLFIGNDSGPTHLAAQIGTATLALFGPSRCDHWHPVGPNAHWINPPTPSPMTWLSVDQVHETCMAILKKNS